ncbi:DUF6801 domain-containing protein [Oryzobacter terrae]|uniref:DUF6801 domain-containing protein n=1 Tax=Oryzobacter terrae TaxID=1620385 RepID=UPI003671768B
MATLLRAAARSGLVGGVALLAAATTVSIASAESRDLEYSCQFGLEMGEDEGTEGSGGTTARFDTAIGSAVVVTTGTSVPLDPFTGSIGLPEDFLQMIRDAQIEQIEGGGVTFMIVDESGEEVVVEMVFPSTPVPATGPLVLELTGEDVPAVTAEEGTNTLLAGDVIVGFGEETYSGGMFCELVDEGDTAVDSFVAEGVAASPTVTASPTTSPVRPVVVQTDFADDRSRRDTLLAGAGLAVAGAVVLGRGGRRAAARRH